MILTGKCKQDFEKWLPTTENRHYKLVERYFFDLPQMFQYSVLVYFFDSYKIRLSIVYDFDISKFYATNNGRYIKDSDFKTRKEARTEAILKANEIYNNR